ncbi:MAG: DegQ family serine endoprotease [bacterium]
MSNRWRKWVGAFLILIVGLLAGLILSAQLDGTQKLEALLGIGEEEKPAVKPPNAQVPQAGPEAAQTDGETVCLPDFGKLAEKIDPAVVNISTTETVKGRTLGRGFGGREGPPRGFGPEQPQDPFEEFFERFFGGINPYGDMKRQSLGSGFIIESGGYILTNHHVVKDADSITVIFRDETETQAKVVGKDPKTDIALIKVDVDRALPVAKLGNSDTLKEGDWVLAIGNPFGLKYTLTAGIVSAKGREIGAGPYDDFIQTDASINPGNSGGPLMNLKGEVVGINTAIVAGGAGIGFAIPINVAQDILPQLREKGRVSRGWLGVMIQRITPELAKSFGLAKPVGALVSEVTQGGPAEDAGLERGDVIIELEGQKVERFNDLPKMVAAVPPGTTVELKVLRKGKEKTVRTKLGELPEEGEAPEPAQGGGENLGLELQEVTPNIARSLGLSSDKGLVVTGVDPESAAAQSGIRRGDIILEVNQKEVATLAEFQKQVQETKPGQMMLFLVKRQEGSLYVAVEKK